jgi:hypothetical protein
MSGKKILQIAAAMGLTALLFSPASARAATDFGFRAGGYSGDTDGAFAGVELLTHLSGGWYLNPNFDYVFASQGGLAVFSVDAHYDFRTHAPFYFWLGGGPSILYRKFDNFDRRFGSSGSQTDFGVNLLAGLGWGKGQAYRPYVQGKVVISDQSEASIGVGLRIH